jgi:hypothetical protein
VKTDLISEPFHIHRPLVGPSQAEEAEHLLGGPDEQAAALAVDGVHEEQHGVHVLQSSLHTCQRGNTLLLSLSRSLTLSLSLSLFFSLSQVRYFQIMLSFLLSDLFLFKFV